MVTAEVRRLRGSGAHYLLLPGQVEGTNEERHSSMARLLQSSPPRPLLSRTPAATVFGVSDPRARSLQELAESLLPEDCAVAVASCGLPSLLDLGGRRTLHFPADPAGAYAGQDVHECEAALEQLAEQAAAGVDYLVVRAFAPGRLQPRPRFPRAVRRQHREMARRAEVAFVFSLQEAPEEEPRPMRVMFVLHNHPSVQPGGTEAYTMEVYRALQVTDGFDPMVVARVPPNPATEPIEHAASPFSPLPEDPNQFLLSRRRGRLRQALHDGARQVPVHRSLPPLPSGPQARRRALPAHALPRLRH